MNDSKRTKEDVADHMTPAQRTVAIFAGVVGIVIMFACLIEMITQI